MRFNKKAMHQDFASTVREGVGNHDWSAKGNVVEMTSGTWQGAEWKHRIVVVEPEDCVSRSACYLEITGDDAGDPDLAYAQALAAHLKIPVAVMFGVPNQPLWDMVEDDLVAHSFERYMLSGDAEWPILVPMVRAGIAAIEVLVDWSLGRFNSFVIGGASKRAWTTWLLAGMGDPRIKGIVPVAFDNLDMADQLKHQVALWKQTSPMLDDYTRRMLHETAFSDEGEALRFLVDPARHLGQINVPVFSVSGSNDPFWAFDAVSRYYKRLPASSAVQFVPNMGHSIGEWDYRLSSVGAFVRNCLGLGNFPRATFEWNLGDRLLTLGCSHDTAPDKVRVWGTTSEDYWFADKEFFVDLLPEARVVLPRREEYNQAVFMELEYTVDGSPVRLTSPGIIVPRPA